MSKGFLWQHFKKIQKELDFLHNQRIDRLRTIFHTVNPDLCKPGDVIKSNSSPHPSIVTEVDYDTGTIIVQRCNILKRIWLWLKRIVHVLMS